jgi:hypothetical protein
MHTINAIKQEILSNRKLKSALKPIMSIHGKIQVAEKSGCV